MAKELCPVALTVYLNVIISLWRPGFRINITILDSVYRLEKGCTSPERQAAVATKFCMVEPNLCGSSSMNLLHITLLAPTILRS